MSEYSVQIVTPVYSKALSAEKAYSIIRDGKNGKFNDLLIDKLQVAMEELL